MKVSYKVLFAAVLSIAGTNAFAADTTITGLATTNYVKGAIESLDSDVKTGNGIVRTITVADGKITGSTRSGVVDADISSISVSKISGAQTTGNLVQTTTKDSSNNVVIPDATSTSKYPSMAVAQDIAAKAASSAVMDVRSDLDTLMDQMDDPDSGLDTKQEKSDANYQVGGANGTWTAISDAVEGDSKAITVSTGTGGKVKVSVNTASSTAYGVVKTGSNISNTSGTISVADGSTTAKGVVQLTDSYASTDSTKAMTGKAVASAISGVTGTANSAVQTVTGSNGVSASKTGTSVTVTGTVAKADAVGVVKPGTDLSVDTNGALSVSKSTTVADKDTKPVTSGAVYTAIESAKTAATGAVTAVGSNGVTASASGGKVTVSGVNATSTTKGVASFTTTGSGSVVTNVSVENGVVTTTKGDLDATSLSGACNKGDTNCALVDLGGAKQWLKIVDTYPAN